MKPAELRTHPVFAPLSDDQIAWLRQQSHIAEYADGDRLFSEIDYADTFYVVLEGELQITKQVGREETVLDHLQPGTYFGEIPILTGRPYRVNGRVKGPTRLLGLPVACFHELLLLNRQTMSEILRTMARRVRAAEILVQQRERTIALGAFAANLAHELNNPAAAARRASGQLNTTFSRAQHLALRVAANNLTPAQHSLLDQLRTRLTEPQPAQTIALDPLTQSDQEDELASWLEQQAISDSWDLAPTLLEAGFDREQLQTLAGQVPPAILPDLVGWLAASSEASRMIAQLNHSTTRISDVVHTVKQYAYMDQAAQQLIDVHTGLDATLDLLMPQLKGNITIERIYDRDLPRIDAYPSELTQVWTNILDNAIDALGGPSGHGTLRISTLRRPAAIVVEIADNGPGIPAALQSRIFKPFFTTKGRERAGLGLDAAYQIIVQRHGGELSVVSEPGNTRFEIQLPLHQA